MRRVLRLLAVAALLGTLLVPATSAQADPPPGDPPAQECEWINGFCVYDPPPYVVVGEEGPPVPQQDTGNSGTGLVAEGEEATGYACGGLRQQEWSFSASASVSYIVQVKVCTENLPGSYNRGKQRITFFSQNAAGLRSTAYGNVRWATSWVHPTYGPPKRYLYQWDNPTGTWNFQAGTKNRSDAIQVHSTVAYSNSDCSVLNTYHYARIRHTFVRLPNGSLAGPFALSGTSYLGDGGCTL